MKGRSYENRRRTRRMLKWRETPIPQQKRIVFRTANLLYGTVDFYSIPLDFGDGDCSNSSSSSETDSSNSSEDCSGEPEGLKPFYKSGSMSQCSVFAAVGSSLFVAGGFVETPSYTGPTDNIYRFDTTLPEKDRCWYVSKMLCPRLCPQTLVMDGKLYIVGGGGSKSVGSDGRYYVASGPWGEVFDPSSLKSSIPLPLPEYPPFLKDIGRCTVTAALHASKRIFVASSEPPSDTAYGYDVVDRVWGELGHKVDFSAIRGQGQPAVVRNGTTLCWLAKSEADVIYAYDLVLKGWFRSPIRGLDKVGADGTPHGRPTHRSLFSLDENHLCLLWIDDCDYADTECPQLNCTKIGVTVGVDAWGGFGFDVFVLSSQSYVLEPQEQLIDALVFGGEEDDGCTKAVMGPNWTPVDGSSLGFAGKGYGFDCGENSGYVGIGGNTAGFACFKFGHLGWELKPVMGVQCIMCSICGGAGHLARDCFRFGQRVGVSGNGSCDGRGGLGGCTLCIPMAVATFEACSVALCFCMISLDVLLSKNSSLPTPFKVFPFATFEYVVV
ncbi:hypothetical protein Vadar_007741 [Vaccinium darrowii]|uniref:Uncharacterized protein n=1 Tax=Vaccinium darrowii TaxID=229202 RepID=A0ACB7XGC5_9ERIC|nr:hypothetical protein Vadar_007741 [Vaccinium darrowii]